MRTAITAASVTLCAALLPATAAKAASVDVPLTLVNHHAYVDVFLNGLGPFHFAFDSGSPFDIVDSEVAASLGLEVRPRPAIGGVGSDRASAGAARIRSLRLGELALWNEAFVVTKLHATFGAAEGRSIDGVLGRGLLQRYVTTFDYGRGSIRIGSDFAAEARAGASVIPMQLRGGIPQIPCRLSDVAAQCNVDTGSRLPITVLAPFAKANPEVVPAELSAVGVDGYGVGGPAYGRLGRLASLGFGALTLREVVCDFSAQTRGAFADPGTAANIGGAVLERFSVTFDYAQRRIAFLPNDAFSRADAYDRSGIFLTARDGELRVLDVRSQTPAADAGIDPDDRIVALDGRSVSPENLQSVRADLRGDAGTIVTLRVERNGVERDLALTLRDYV